MTDDENNNNNNNVNIYKIKLVTDCLSPLTFKKYLKTYLLSLSF